MTGRTERARGVGLWLRDTGLGVAGYVLVTVVAIAGWSGSFIGLHTFAMEHMDLSERAAWFVPVTFDGAALGLTMTVARAAMHGRGALVWRLLVVAFTALSAWINWTHISDPRGRWVAALLPISAVTVFEALMGEARQAYERRSGRVRPRIHPLRWVFDRRGTLAIVRSYVLDVPLPDRFRPTDSTPTAAPIDRPAPVESTPVDPIVPPVDRPTPCESAPVGWPVDPIEVPDSIPVAPVERTAEAPLEAGRLAPDLDVSGVERISERAPEPARSTRRVPRPDRGRSVPESARPAPRRSIDEVRADARRLVESGRIDLDTVTIEGTDPARSLCALLGIGPVRARQILRELRDMAAESADSTPTDGGARVLPIGRR